MMSGEDPKDLIRKSLSYLGDVGEIVQVGTHTEENFPVYLVEFGERLVVGCLEEEIIPL